MNPGVLRATTVAGGLATVLFGVHAFVFRSIPNFPDDPPIDFPAKLPTLFFSWVLASMVAWVLFVTFLPALWTALGRGLLATLSVLLLFIGIMVNLVGDGMALAGYPLATAYESALDALRPGLAEAIVVNRRAVSIVFTPGILAIFGGALGVTVTSALGRIPAPRWYGGLVLVWLLLQVPIGPEPALVWGMLTVLAFGALVFTTWRTLGPSRRRVVAA